MNTARHTLGFLRIFASLPPGFYTLSVETPGFKRYVSTQNKLDPNIATQIDATLESLADYLSWDITKGFNI